MMRLIQIEWLKIKSLKALWIMTALYFIALIMVSVGAKSGLDFLTAKGMDFNGINPSIVPLYAYDDLWQNLAYMASFFKIFPAFILIISMSNEFTYRTHRQNVIDGLSRSEFLLSKMSFAAFLALLSAVVLLLLGFLLGSLHSDVRGTEYMFQSIEFVLAHALQFFIYFTGAMLLVLWIRRSGISIVLLLLYTLLLERIITGILRLALSWDDVINFFPLRAINRLVPNPFGKYIFQETQTFLGLQDLAIALLWLGLFTFGIHWQLRKRDF